MNIFFLEFKSGFRTFFFWMIGMFFLVFAGMVKYTGFGEDTSIMLIFDQFPRVVLAVFGMVGIDITTLGGYYSMIAYYVMLCAAIYGIHLGTGAVTKESVDKTYEFVFTKPKSRMYILNRKLISGIIYLLLFSIANVGMSHAAAAALEFHVDITKEIILFSIVIFLIGILFMTLATLITSYVRSNEKGMRYANISFLVFFVISTIFNMLEDGGVLKILAPFKYFAAWDIVDGILDVKFLFITIFLIVLFYGLSVYFFEKKDFIA